MKKERVIELHQKGLSAEIIALRVGLSKRHVFLIIQKFKDAQ